MPNHRIGRLLSLGIVVGIIIVFAKCGSVSSKQPYDIIHYDLTVVPDFDTKIIDLKASVEIENTGLEDSLWFGLNDRYDSVVLKAGSDPVPFEREDGWLLVHLENPKQKIILNFELKGMLGQSKGERCEVVGDSNLFLLWSDRFYPIDFDDWATVRTKIVLPQGFLAIAPGLLNESHSGENKIEYAFQTKQPAVRFSVFADNRWIKTERIINGIQMQTLLHPESQEYAAQIFRTSSDVLKFYSETYCPYSFDQFGFVTLKGTYARRAFSGFIGYSPKYLEKEFTTTGHDAHETALLWWGHTIKGSGPYSSLWTEGFGDYAEILYVEKYNKPIPKIFHWQKSKYLELPAEKDAIYNDMSGRDYRTVQPIMHGKFPWLMHLIRYVSGDEAFIRAMRLLFKRYRFRTFTMDEFIATLEEGIGQLLDWWRTEWLERKGVPEIKLNSEISEEENAHLITVILEQKNNLYHFPVEIGIQTSEGIRTEQVMLSEEKQTFTFTSEMKPDSILLDPDGWILMKKE